MYEAKNVFPFLFLPSTPPQPELTTCHHLLPPARMKSCCTDHKAHPSTVGVYGLLQFMRSQLNGPIYWLLNRPKVHPTDVLRLAPKYSLRPNLESSWAPWSKILALDGNTRWGPNFRPSPWKWEVTFDRVHLSELNLVDCMFQKKKPSLRDHKR
jgi:hypothetical protein